MAKQVQGWLGNNDKFYSTQEEAEEVEIKEEILSLFSLKSSDDPCYVYLAMFSNTLLDLLIKNKYELIRLLLRLK